MPEIESENAKAPLNKDLKRLRRRIRRLAYIPPAKLDDAICDIIDLKGFAPAALLFEMPRLPAACQLRIAIKIEDFLFFHPALGKRLLVRLLKAVSQCDSSCKRHLVSAFADVINRIGTKNFNAIPMPVNEALAMLSDEVDLMRQAKAVEILARAEDPAHIPSILHGIQRALKRIDQYDGFHFAETALFALRKIGGDGFLRLLINPSSPMLHTQLRMAWQTRPLEQINTALRAAMGLDENFAAMMLKVIDLAEFNLPFLAMIQEGMNHTDKWVRQMAVESMSKIADTASAEQIGRMLNDPAPEVRLMAVSALGGCPPDRTGTLLGAIASGEQETYEIRMNALYALFAQKNQTELEKLTFSPTRFVSNHATGLAALLQKREDGLQRLLDASSNLSSEDIKDIAHYILELAQPEDIGKLLAVRARLQNTSLADAFFEVLRAFLQQRSGPNLEKALSELPSNERDALKVLETGVFGSASTVKTK